MSQLDDAMKAVVPSAVLKQIAESMPEDCRQYIVVIGSLAAGYRFFAANDEIEVRTKDADCLITPRVRALSTGRKITERLFESGWTYRPDERWPESGTAETPDTDLPAVRLRPPDSNDWFIELLTVPEIDSRDKAWMPLETAHGRFGLPSFGFLALVDYKPLDTPLRIRIAQPGMMALANLLEHPEIGEETMSGLIAGRQIKRSNKDLGRVLALAWLAVDEEEDALLKWADDWTDAVMDRFPGSWKDLARRSGSGLRQLLNSPNDLSEAYHACVNGLLARKAPNLEQLRIAGLRLIADAIEPLERAAGG